MEVPLSGCQHLAATESGLLDVKKDGRRNK
jgi:hypothetical protein